MPKHEDQFRHLSDQFYKYGYPNVIGAIDGTGIDVIVPAADKLDYFTRKYRTSLNLTAVCDAHKKLCYINVGHSERSHDSHIFRCSPIGKMITDERAIPAQYHILGDAAYGLHTSVMVPYVGTNLSADEQRHNDIHSSTRMAIERTFGDLKSRWLRLQKIRCDIKLATKIIAVCCALHNICIDSGDIVPTDIPSMSVLCVTNAAAKHRDIARHLRMIATQ